MATWRSTVVKTPDTLPPMATKVEMATTEMKARTRPYSTKVWPPLVFEAKKSRERNDLTLGM